MTSPDMNQPAPDIAGVGVDGGAQGSERRGGMTPGTAWGWPWTEVFVDFNDLGRDPDELHACYPEHVRGLASLQPGQPVILTDCESIQCEGTVLRIYDNGRGSSCCVCREAGHFPRSDGRRLDRP